MRKFKRLLRAAATAMSVCLPAVAWADSLCAADEKPLMTSKLEKSDKFVSLCQAKGDSKKIYYKFGTPQKVEITLPNAKSAQPSIHFEQFGTSETQWMKSIRFPLGKVVYSLTTWQGLSVTLAVDGTKKPLQMNCEAETAGADLQDAYDIMEKLGFKRK